MKKLILFFIVIVSVFFTSCSEPYLTKVKCYSTKGNIDTISLVTGDNLNFAIETGTFTKQSNLEYFGEVVYVDIQRFEIISSELIKR